MVDGADVISRECVPYVKQEIPVERVLALVDLVNKCKAKDIGISAVVYMKHGFSVRFDGIDGDAILHDGSYGKNTCEWETACVPWCPDEFAVYDADGLVWRLSGVKEVPADERYMLTHHVGMGGCHYEYFADPGKAIERAKLFAEKKVVDFFHDGTFMCDAYQFDHYGNLDVFDRWSKVAIYNKGE